MLHASAKFVTSHTFAVPFLVGAIMCSLWGGVINLLLFIGLSYLILKLVKAMSKPNAVGA